MVKYVINRAILNEYAALAKIRFDENHNEDIEAINELLGIADKISDIELLMDGYPLNLELTNTYREDIAKPSIPCEDVIANAKDVEAGCISVPKILGDEEQ